MFKTLINPHIQIAVYKKSCLFLFGQNTMKIGKYFLVILLILPGFRGVYGWRWLAGWWGGEEGRGAPALDGLPPAPQLKYRSIQINPDLDFCQKN